MEQLLRGEKIPAVNLFDMEAPVQYFPIRHHSPVCGWHLKQCIERYQPDCILIEGPQNAQEQIGVLAHPDTKAPAALYYFYRDSKGLLSKDKEDYRCYYPFVDSSPELVALREAGARGIPAYFIDLPYGEILLGTKASKGIRTKQEKQTYNDDYLLSRSRYLQLLCEKSGLRDFEEFWEKYFEIDGLYHTTERFVFQMYTYCSLTREHTPKEELEEDGCLLRERFMAQQAAEKSEQYKKMLIVTGGFHTSGLMQLLKQEKRKLVFTGEPVILHGMSKEDQGVYPLAYSMEAADALNGYASGMQSPGFYQQVWERLNGRKESKGAYEDAVLHHLTLAGRRARKKKESVSSYDVICALTMAKGLAALRGKKEPGLYELRDSALSSFVKGELNLSTDLPLRILDKINTGDQVGCLCKDALRPPLLYDFEEQCRTFGFQIQVSTPKDVVLQLFTKKKHLEMSRFLYRMEYLGTGFAKKKKGADLVSGRDQNRVREIWSYQFSSQVSAVLIDVSMSGGTVEEAAHSRLLKQFSGSSSTKEAAGLLAQGFLMGFWEDQAHMNVRIRKILTEDGDFFSLTEGFSHLKRLYELRELYQVEEDAALLDMLAVCFQKILQLLPSMAQVPKEQASSCMKACLSLYQMTGKSSFLQYRPLLTDGFLRLLDKKDVLPELEGTVMGLLYGDDGQYEERICRTAAGYLQGTDVMQMNSAAFLRGLFYTAKDLIFVQEGFLTMIDGLIEQLPADAFLQLLPELRMAFGYFTPLETDRIAQKAASLHGVDKQQLLKGRMVSPLEYEYGESLDAYALLRMQEEWT